MSLKTFKPYTKSRRGTVLIDRKNLLILIGMIILILILFYPLIFNGKVFGSPDSLSPRGANIILNR